MKDFTPKTRKEQIEFKLYGHVFTCRPMVQSGIVLGFLDLVDLMGAEEDENVDEGQGLEQIRQIMVAVNNLFEAALPDAEFAAWVEMRESKDKIIDLPSLIEIATWLAGKYAEGSFGERPTGGPSEGGSFKKSRGNGSTAGARPKALTYSRPEPTSLTA